MNINLFILRNSQVGQLGCYEVSFSDRVQERANHLKLKQVDVVKHTKASKATVSKWFNQDVMPDSHYLLLLARILQCSQEWLVTGKGSVEGANITPAPIDLCRIPIISYVQAGCWTESVECRDLDGSIKYITTDLDVGHRTFAAEIQGDSMQPEFVEGDVVLIDPDEPYRPGDYVMAKNGEHEATFKKYKSRGHTAEGRELFDLVPLNDSYPTLHSDISQIKIIGTMVEHRRCRRRKN